MKYVLMALIRVYQLTVSPLLGPVCRFYPSCSHYAYEAIARHGAVYGSYLTVRRLLRCHPWNPGGVDLVPEKGERAWWRFAKSRPTTAAPISGAAATAPPPRNPPPMTPSVPSTVGLPTPAPFQPPQGA